MDGAEPGMIFNTVTKQLYDGEAGSILFHAITNGNMLSGVIEARAQVLL